MFDFLDPFVDYFLAIYRADKRPEARKLTIGCFVIILILIGLLAVIFSVRE